MRADQAEDLVQDFCCRLVERRTDLGGLDPAGGRFRAWLVTVFKNFISDQRARHLAQMRGGTIHHQTATEAGLTTACADPEFDRDWAEIILANARARLTADHLGDKARLFVFLERIAEPDEYHIVARDLGLSEGAVKVAVHRLRQRFYEAVRAEISETLAEPTP